MTQLKSKGLTINKTLKYIKPCLDLYGRSFQRDLDLIHIKGWFIGDFDYEIKNNVKINALFCVCDNYMSTHDFVRKYHDTETIFDYYSIGKDKICIIINLPNSIKTNIIELFKEGKYSELFDSQMIDDLFPKELRVKNEIINNEAYYIIKKHDLRKKKFAKILNEDFGVSITLDEKDDRELEYKPTLKDEILNFTKPKKSDYELLK